MHPMQGDELRALRELRRGSPTRSASSLDHLGNIGARVLSAWGCAAPYRLAGRDTRRLQLWLGHSDIKHTARYSELSAKPATSGART